MMHRVVVTGAVAAFALALACFGIRPAAADDAAALIAKHAAFVGWHAGDGVVKTLRASGEVTREGKPRGTIISLRYGLSFRDTFQNLDGLQSDEGFTGSVPWTSNENGFTIRPVGEIVRALFDVDALFSEATTSDGFTAALLRHDKVDGVDCAVVRLTSQAGFPLDVYVDPATGAYRRAVVDPDGKYEESFDGLDYATVDGKRFLSAWHHGDSKTRYAYTKIEPNAPLEPDQLRPPKQTATWTFGDDPATIEYVEQPAPRIYLDVKVNGVKGKFILDTGASRIAMLDSFARRAGGKRVSTTGFSGIGGGHATANVFRMDAVTVGGSTLHDVLVSSGLDEQDFEHLGVVGIIGFDLFAATVADLNLDTKTLRLMDPAKVAPDASAGMLVRVDLSDRHIRMPMRLDDTIDVIATLDSGNPSDVLFSRDLIKRDHFDFHAPYAAYISGVAGTERVECGRLKSLTLGPVRYQTPLACASASFARNEILVGLDFMRAFNFVFDYSNGVVMMIPRKHY